MRAPELIKIVELRERLDIGRDAAYQFANNQGYINNGIVVDLNKGKKGRRYRKIRINWDKYSMLVGID